MTNSSNMLAVIFIKYLFLDFTTSVYAKLISFERLIKSETETLNFVKISAQQTP